MGLALYERLLLLDATLKSIPPRVVHQLQGASQPARGQPAAQYRGRSPGEPAVRGARVRRRRRRARARVRPAGRTADPDRTSTARISAPASPSSCTAPGGPASTRTFMLRRLDRGGEAAGTLIGEVSPEFLWGVARSSLPIADHRHHGAGRLRPVLFRVHSGGAGLAGGPDHRGGARGGGHRPARATPAVASRPFVSSASPDSARRGVRRAHLDAGPERVGGRGAGAAGAVHPAVRLGHPAARASPCCC